jgi:hypothetical protein
LSLKDSEGNIHERFFPGAHEDKWDDSKWISEGNKWRSQTLRRLFKVDPDYRANPNKRKWTETELNHLKAQILSRVRLTRRRLTGQDWKIIAEEHNQKFAGTATEMGKKHLDTGISTSSQTAGKRTVSALHAVYRRLPELIDQINDLIENNSDSQERVRGERGDEENGGHQGESGDVAGIETRM